MTEVSCTEHSCEYFSPIGRLVLRSDGEKLTELILSNDAVSGISDSALAQTKRWLDIYFSGSIPQFTPPMSYDGTSFRKLIWDMLSEIPYGKTVTYGELAKKAAVKLQKSKMSAQAVGGAVGRNPICIIIPCHRVIGSDGSLVGYGYGTDIKRYLLEFEKKNITEV